MFCDEFLMMLPVVMRSCVYFFQTLAAEVDSRIVKLVSSPCRLDDDKTDQTDHQALLDHNQVDTPRDTLSTRSSDAPQMSASDVNDVNLGTKADSSSLRLC